MGKGNAGHQIDICDSNMTYVNLYINYIYVCIALLRLNVKPALLCFCDVAETFFKLFLLITWSLLSEQMSNIVKTPIPITK